jgi:hypothetical protein
MEIHYKCTTWCKLKLPDGTNKEEILEKLNRGDLPLDIAYNVNFDFNVEWEAINETEEFLPVEENDGQATIELMEEQEGKIGLQCIWDNSFESELKRKENE